MNSTCYHVWVSINPRQCCQSLGVVWTGLTWQGFGLKWCTKVTLLGLDFDQSLQEKDNIFAKAVEKMCKICVIKTLMLPKLAHIAAILPNISMKKIEEVEKICLKFLRTNKRSIVDSSRTL